MIAQIQQLFSAILGRPVSFGEPELLWMLVIPPLLLLCGAAGKRGRERSLFVHALRALTLTLLILALARPGVEDKQEKHQYSALIDLSLSVPDNAVRAMVDQLLPFAARDDAKISIVAFAGRPSGDPIIADAQSNAESITAEILRARSSVASQETNLSAALRQLIGGNLSSILLLSDGFDTAGDARQAARSAAARGTAIFPLLPGESLFRQPQLTISSLHAPITSGAGDKVEVRVSLKNTFADNRNAALELWLDNEKLDSRELEVEAGAERLVSIETPALKGGLQRLRALVRGGSGAMQQPAERHRWISVKEKEKLLLISGTAEDQRILKELIRFKGYGVETIIADGNDKIPVSFAAFSAVVINNTAREQLPKDFLGALEEFVKRGGGALLIGGDRMYGLGRYIDTPLEKISPLKFVPPRTEKRRLKVAVTLVVDKSGSMEEENRIGATKEAAIASINSLKDEDYISVIGFDHAPFVVIPLKPVAEVKEIAERRLRSLTAAGQTNPLPALAAARQALVQCDAGRKHIIILSDGRFPLTTDVYAEEINRLKAAGVTVSAVAMGMEADVPFMKFLAQQGKGAFYQTLDPSKLPKIFLEDIKVTSGERTLAEGETFPVGAGPGGIVSTTIERFPPLKGFVETLPKKGSTLELITRKEENLFPILASWKYEQGSVVAFTSDANGRWSDPWVRWPEFAKFWSQLLEGLKPDNNTDAGQVDFDLRYSVVRKTLAFELSVFDPKLQAGSAPQITARVVEPGGELRDTIFRPVKKGRFSGRIENARAGDFKLDIKYGNLNLPPVAITIPAESFGEAPGRGINVPYLEEIAYLSGGVINPDASQVLSKVQTTAKRKELFIPLLLAAFALILIEALIRELGGFALIMPKAEAVPTKRARGTYHKLVGSKRA